MVKKLEYLGSTSSRSISFITESEEKLAHELLNSGWKNRIDQSKKYYPLNPLPDDGASLSNLESIGMKKQAFLFSREEHFSLASNKFMSTIFFLLTVFIFSFSSKYNEHSLGQQLISFSRVRVCPCT